MYERGVGVKRIVSFIAVSTLVLICLSSCAGYNKIMRDHLSTPDNYHKFEAIVADVFYLNPKTSEIQRNFDTPDFLDFDVTIYIQFEDHENVSAFLGRTSNPDMPLDEHEYSLCIPAANSKILHENGFYKNISAGDKISITSSNWIYMDSDFFYVAHAESDGVVYLNFEDGLKNIIAMMNNDKSLF